MNYYEEKILQDRENSGAIVGILLILFSPVFGFFIMFLGAMFGVWEFAFWVGTIVTALIGVGCIVGAIRQHRERKQMSHE